MAVSNNTWVPARAIQPSISIYLCRGKNAIYSLAPKSTQTIQPRGGLDFRVQVQIYDRRHHCLIFQVSMTCREIMTQW